MAPTRPNQVRRYAVGHTLSGQYFTIKSFDQHCEIVISSDRNKLAWSVRTRLSFDVKPCLARRDDVFSGPSSTQLSFSPLPKENTGNTIFRIFCSIYELHEINILLPVSVSRMENVTPAAALMTCSVAPPKDGPLTSLKDEISGHTG